MFKIIDRVNGEILESINLANLIQEAHNRIEEYEKENHKEYYFCKTGNMNYEINEYFGKRV